MIVLLAGYKGFLGSHVEQLLKDKGITVYRYYRHTNKPFDAVVKEADVIINCGGNTERPESMFDDNVGLTADLLEGARAFNKRIIHVGSMMEDQPGNSLYQSTKRAATQLCLGYEKQFEVEVSIVKLSTLYGPGDKSTAFLPTLWNAHMEKKPFAPTNEFRSWTHVKDAASGIVDIARDLYSSGTYPLAAEYIHNLAIVDLFEKEVGTKVLVDLKHLRSEGYSWPVDVCVSVFNLGWSPTYTMEDGVKEFVTSMREPGEVWLGAEA